MNKIIIFTSLIATIIVSILNVAFYYSYKNILINDTIFLLISLMVFIFMLSGRQLYLSIYILYLCYVMFTKLYTIYILRTKEEVKDYSMKITNGLISGWLLVMIIYLIYIYVNIKLSSKGLTMRKGSTKVSATKNS